MSANTKIEWTDETWNPMVGCSKVSEGCRNCYAMHVAHVRAGNPALERKFGGTTRREGGKTIWTGKVNLSEDALLLPLQWKRPRRVFVNSMSDLFHGEVPDDWIDRVFAIMALTPQHTYQILTKRAERLPGYMDLRTEDRKAAIGRQMRSIARGMDMGTPELPLLNVWLGVSVENQASADERIPKLLDTPAAVRFISAEPLLGPIDLNRIDYENGRNGWGPRRKTIESSTGWEHFSPAGQRLAAEDHGREQANEHPRLDWVIVGGESGRGARPCDVRWIEDVLRQCQEAKVPCFVKQLGARPKNLPTPTVTQHVVSGMRLPLLNTKGGDPGEWPLHLRVRQFPQEHA